MTRMSKQGERRAVSKRRPKLAGPKTGPKKDALPLGYRPHENAVATSDRFIPKIG